MSLKEGFREIVRNTMGPVLKLICQMSSKFVPSLNAYFDIFWNEEGGFSRVGH